jgi:hypothetical protein
MVLAVGELPGKNPPASQSGLKVNLQIQKEAP